MGRPATKDCLPLLPIDLDRCEEGPSLESLVPIDVAGEPGGAWAPAAHPELLVPPVLEAPVTCDLKSSIGNTFTKFGSSTCHKGDHCCCPQQHWQPQQGLLQQLVLSLAAADQLSLLVEHYLAPVAVEILSPDLRPLYRRLARTYVGSRRR